MSVEPMSAMLDVNDDRVWTPDLLCEFLEQERDFDLDWRRFEIVDGVLVVSPPAIPRHELIIAELIAALRSAMPSGYHVIGSAGIEMGRSYRVPDVTVLADHAFGGARGIVDPQDVLLAVEIESPSSVTTDRITKPAQYSAAGIEHYWRIEKAPLRLSAYRLVDGVYASAGAWTAPEVAVIEHPFRVSIDLGSLLPV